MYMSRSMLFLSRIILLCVYLPLFSQNGATLNKNQYEQALSTLSETLEGQPGSFKACVFDVENAYFDGELAYQQFDAQITFLAGMAAQLSQSQELEYRYPDAEKVKKYAAIFSVLTDSILLTSGENAAWHIPFHYDFEDVFGDRDWSQMFVLKLLATRRGNCHSLPYLYKILCEELGVRAHLALAPNHVYIKQYAEKTGWYNTELTSATFPVDAWLMASGYISLPAIQNGIYLDTLSERESIALCVIDLAQGYANKYPDHDGSFVLRCCKLALQHFPDCIPALLLQADTYAKQFQALAQQNPESPETAQAFKNMNQAYAHIHQLGYRQMPKEMYADWLLSLQMEKEKYVNPNVATFKQGKE
jgi:hypothetical protein